jgi:hypothetical protein
LELDSWSLYMVETSYFDSRWVFLSLVSIVLVPPLSLPLCTILNLSQADVTGRLCYRFISIYWIFLICILNHHYIII